MKKILLIDNSSFVTGAVRSITTLTNLLAKKNEFHICSPRNLVGHHNFFKVQFLEITKSFKAVLYLPVLLYNSFRVLSYVRTKDIRVVHINDLYNMCGIVVKILRPDIKLIYHIRLLPSSYVGSLYKVWQFLILRFADEIICVSEVVASHWPKRSNIHVIYDAINTRERLPRKRMEGSNTITLLYLANYINGKGHDVALKVIASIYRSNRQIRLKMVGGDLGMKKNLVYKNELMDLSRSLGIDDVVSFEGFSDDVASLMENADIFLNFSQSESFSMTCLEASYHGTPCIATNSGGPAEIIVNNESGFIVPVGSHEAMVNAVLKLIADDKLRDKFSLAGQKRARELFDAEIQATHLERIYLA